MLLLVSAIALADHESGAELAWHAVAGGLDQSRVAIYRGQRLLGIYDFDCDLTGIGAVDTEFEGAAIELLRPRSHPEGLLVISCNVGAHSQHLAIVDPGDKAARPAFAVTGSYFAGWEIEDGELWISYDRACDSGPTVECPDGFETLFESFPAGPQSAAGD